jgi:tRNA(Leu) C34 or U34 (ribose-2'-O)-methylase TrmL
MVDKPVNFEVDGSGEFQTPFGDQLALFVYHVCQSVHEVPNPWFLTIWDSLKLCSSRLTVIFLLQGLKEYAINVEPHQALNKQSVLSIRECLHGMRAVSVLKNPMTKELIASDLEVILMTMCIPSQMDCFFLLIHSLLTVTQNKSNLSRYLSSHREWLWEEIPKRMEQLDQGNLGEFHSERDAWESLIQVMVWTDGMELLTEWLHRRGGTPDPTHVMILSHSLHWTTCMGLSFPWNASPSMFESFLLHTEDMETIDHVCVILFHLYQQHALDTTFLGIHLERSTLASKTIQGCYHVYAAFAYFHMVSQISPQSMDTNMLTRIYDTQIPRPRDMEHFNEIQTKCTEFKYRIVTNVMVDRDITPFWDRLVESMEEATISTLDAILGAAIQWVPRMEVVEISSTMRMIQSCLCILESEWNASKYWITACTQFARFAFHPRHLTCPELDLGPVFEVYQKWAETRPLVVECVPGACFFVWRHVDRHAMQSMTHYLSWFVEFLLYGPNRYLDTLDHKHEAVLLLRSRNPTREERKEKRGTCEWNFYIRDYAVRVQAWDVLLRLRPDQEEHVAFVVKLVDRLVEVMQSGVYQAKYVNSHVYKKSIRLWCTFHLLLDLVPKDRFSLLFQQVMDWMVQDTLNESRVFMEWLASRMVILDPSLTTLFWSYFDQPHQKSSGTVSLISMCRHVQPHLDSLFLETAVEKITPWVSTNHFTIRLTAQYVLYTFPPTTSPFVRFFDTKQDIKKHFVRCQEYYFLSQLDVVQDVNLEFLLQKSMELLHVDVEERISPAAFVKVQTPSRIPLWSTRRIEIPPLESPPVPAPMIPTTQKKIVPWERLLQQNLDVSSDRLRPQLTRNPMIVVATLLDKIPNLGGLCRTCETLNMELLVVSNLSVTQDVNFQATCVSAEKWMPMHPVREPDLETYLVSKKQQGYTLVGLEQAMDSVPLPSYSFDRNTVLVLGNEKQGIPARILVLLDSIVEIPQYGLIRSLNVHVSASMMMWEYIKQHPPS